jgi:hypothetical protein
MAYLKQEEFWQSDRCNVSLVWRLAKSKKRAVRVGRQVAYSTVYKGRPREAGGSNRRHMWCASRSVSTAAARRAQLKTPASRHRHEERRASRSRNKAGRQAGRQSGSTVPPRVGKVAWPWHGLYAIWTSGARSSPHRSFFNFFSIGGSGLTRGGSETHEVHGRRHDTHGVRVRGCCTTCRLCAAATWRAARVTAGGRTADRRRADSAAHFDAHRPPSSGNQSTLPDPGAQPQVGLELILTSPAGLSRPRRPSIVDSAPLGA